MERGKTRMAIAKSREGKVIESLEVDKDTVDVIGAKRVRAVHGIAGFGVVAEFDSKPCLVVSEGSVRVQPCAAGSREE